MYRKILIFYCFYCNLITVTKGQLTLTASYDGGEFTSCIATDGPNVVLTCRISMLDGSVYWEKNEINQAICSYSSGNCFPSFPSSRHTFSSNIFKGEFYYSIANFSVSDEGNYTCQSNYDTASFKAKLCVPVISVTLKQNNLDVDNQLMVTAGQPTTFQCIPSPSMPSPTILWYIGSDLLQNSTNTAYTFIASNADHDKVFYCKAYNTRPSEAKTSVMPSLYVRVAVASVTLKYGSTELHTGDVVNVTSGTLVTLNCTPGFSRPTATVDWYKGSSIVLTSSLSFSFTPTNNDHDKAVYCKAYNLNRSESVESGKPQLFVLVEVRSVTITNGVQNLTTGENLTVTQGESTTVTCIPGTSRPTPTINWFIDNREQPYSGPSFTFISNNTLHGKVIHCSAYNIQSKSQAVTSNSPEIYVFVRAGSPRLLNGTGDTISFMEGDRYNVQCQSTPTRPAAVIKWLIRATFLSATSTTVADENGLVSVISTLSYIGAKADHNAALICSSRIPSQTDSPETRKTIQILWRPSTPTIQAVPSLPWLEGQTGTLSCITSDWGNPASSLSWTSTVGFVNTQNQLAMRQLNYQHDKLTVNCQLQNQFTSTKGVIVDADIILDVQYKPILTLHVDGISVNEITVIEGQNKDVVCTAVGNPQPMVTWPGAPGLSSGSTLRFRNISRTQAGNYSCQGKATSSAHPSHEFASVQTMQVTVNYPPDARITLETRDQHQIVIKCSADGKPAVYMFDEWLHMAPDNSTEIQRYSGDTVGSENILVLKNVTYMDSGYYTCKVSNSITTITAHLGEAERLVSVKEKPVVTQAETMISAGLGDDIRVNITFFSNDKKEPGVKWFKVANGTRSEIQNVLGEIFHIKTYSDTVVVQYYTKQVTQLGYTSQLALRNLKSTDFGEYDTEMYNSIGTIYHKTSIVPQGAPEEPFSLRVVADSETSSSISFTWLSGYHGGADQTFHIQYKTSEATQWIEGLTVFGGSGVHISFNGTVAGLSEDTAYHFRIYSRNVYGSSHSTDIVYARTSKAPVSSRLENDNNAGAIAGGVIAGVLGLVILILVIVLVLRRFGRLPGIRLYNKEFNESRNGSSNYDTINHQKELAETYQELHVTYQTDEQKGDQKEEIRRVSTTRSSLNAYEDLELRKSKGGTNMSPTVEDTSRRSSPKSVIYYNLKLSFD